MVNHSGITLCSVNTKLDKILLQLLKKWAHHKTRCILPSEGFDQIQISCVALQQEKPVQNQKTDYPVKFYSSGYLWIYKIREKLN